MGYATVPNITLLNYKLIDWYIYIYIYLKNHFYLGCSTFTSVSNKYEPLLFIRKPTKHEVNCKINYDNKTPFSLYHLLISSEEKTGLNNSNKFCMFVSWIQFYHRITELLMVWAVRDLKVHLVPSPLPWAIPLPLESGCSRSHPTWPGTLLEMQHPEILWAICVSLPSQERISS